MRAGTRIEYGKFVGLVRAVLGELGYTYFKNETRRITEFEIQSPCKFRVLVEDCRGGRSAFGLFKSRQDESAIELWRSVGAAVPDDLLKKSVDSFLERLWATMPREPWEGFGHFRKASEKSRWAELGRI